MIFRDGHALVAVGPFGDLRVGRAIALRKLQGVQCVVSGVVEEPRQARRRLRVDEELFAAPSGITR